jgi:hypothetical protein
MDVACAMPTLSKTVLRLPEQLPGSTYLPPPLPLLSLLRVARCRGGLVGLVARLSLA